MRKGTPLNEVMKGKTDKKPPKLKRAADYEEAKKAMGKR